jgi:hypothetical protein
VSVPLKQELLSASPGARRRQLLLPSRFPQGRFYRRYLAKPESIVGVVTATLPLVVIYLGPGFTSGGGFGTAGRALWCDYPLLTAPKKGQREGPGDIRVISRSAVILGGWNIRQLQSSHRMMDAVIEEVDGRQVGAITG